MTFRTRININVFVTSVCGHLRHYVVNDAIARGHDVIGLCLLSEFPGVFDVGIVATEPYCKFVITALSQFYSKRSITWCL